MCETRRWHGLRVVHGSVMIVQHVACCDSDLSSESWTILGSEDLSESAREEAAPLVVAAGPLEAVRLSLRFRRVTVAEQGD